MIYHFQQSKVEVYKGPVSTFVREGVPVDPSMPVVKVYISGPEYPLPRKYHKTNMFLRARAKLPVPEMYRYWILVKVECECY